MMRRSSLVLAFVLFLFTQVAGAQARPPAPRNEPRERGFGAAAERTQRAGAERIAKERRDDASEPEPTQDGGSSAVRFKPVPEERALSFLAALEKRMKSVRSQAADFVAAEYGPVGLLWQARGRYEALRSTDGTLRERLQIAGEERGVKAAEERILFVTTSAGRCSAWRHTAEKGALPLGEDPLAIVLRGPVLLFDLLPLDPVHMAFEHTGEASEGKQALAQLRARPRHGRKDPLRLVFDRSNAALLRGAVDTESKARVSFTDTNGDCDGFRLSTSRKLLWGTDGAFLVLQFSARCVNKPADAARFTAEGLAR
ncbi:MAG: hypothetical protein EXS14_01860 [Planctomycetes bacterium]|nr:hypothetical protein [Planctomycetota bacterium]